MVILEPDGTLSHNDDHTGLPEAVQPGDSPPIHDDPERRIDLDPVTHHAFDVPGLKEVAYEIEQAVAQLAHELQHLPLFNLPIPLEQGFLPRVAGGTKR